MGNDKFYTWTSFRKNSNYVSPIHYGVVAKKLNSGGPILRHRLKTYTKLGSIRTVNAETIVSVNDYFIREYR